VYREGCRIYAQLTISSEEGKIVKVLAVSVAHTPPQLLVGRPFGSYAMSEPLN